MIKIVFLVLLFSLSCTQQQKSIANEKVIVDSLGRKVSIPNNVQRLITIDRGFVPQILHVLDKEYLLVATGGVHPNAGPYNREKTDTFFIVPHFLDIPTVGWAGYGGYNFEKIVEVNPELIIIVAYSSFSENSYHKQLLDRLENEFKIPVVVLEDYGSINSLESINSYYNSINIVGEIVNDRDGAKKLISKLQKQFDIAKSFVSKDKNERMLFLGVTDGDTGGGYVYGRDFSASALTTSLLNINNVWTNSDSPIFGVETILEFNPDIIALVDAPAASKSYNLYKTNPIFKNINAVKNDRIYYMGQLQWWSDSKLMFPLKMLLYSAIYYQPEGVSLNNIYENYMFEIFGIDKEDSKKLITIHKLNSLMDN